MTKNFVLMTDDNCDMPQAFYQENGIAVLKMFDYIGPVIGTHTGPGTLGMVVCHL